ncbi:GcrA family cell cycle regulator [Martelella endophytica]|uniref:GcrA cell cycle regulator n=1 Tax=Martelella endophytica TaxID=1486262 RepID=A0A0D5LPK1_MAREN|nr:GcrA family cell cycle regulator [Martelella endophytica]AJY45697.1 GcrA cell cycle regulator [Martelella endophytica]
MSWTDERVEKLKQLWSEGLSASQIATQLGGVSRNAVIGKVHRLALPGRAKSGTPATASATRPTNRNTTPPRAPNFASRAAGRTQPSAPPPQATPSAPRTAGATALKQETVIEAEAAPAPQAKAGVVVPIMRKIALTELTERTCKWPVGDPTADDFFFCGCESPENSPYCSYHAKLAYQPVSERRRAS